MISYKEATYNLDPVSTSGIFQEREINLFYLSYCIFVFFSCFLCFSNLSYTPTNNLLDIK